jgi:hypothetical protein
MQYTIQLPKDYNPELIRNRAHDRKRLFEGLPGLVHKSYLFSEADKIYAPFYIWSDVREARSFLLNDLFEGVIQSFRRPRVRTWMVLDSVYGNTSLSPTFAVREADAIPAEENLERLFAREKEKQQELAANTHLHFHAVALDADRWELVRYSLWRDETSAEKPASDCAQTYEVLHYQYVTS